MSIAQSEVLPHEQVPGLTTLIVLPCVSCLQFWLLLEDIWYSLHLFEGTLFVHYLEVEIGKVN